MKFLDKELLLKVKKTFTKVWEVWKGMTPLQKHTIRAVCFLWFFYIALNIWKKWLCFIFCLNFFFRFFWSESIWPKKYCHAKGTECIRDLDSTLVKGARWYFRVTFEVSSIFWGSYRLAWYFDARVLEPSKLLHGLVQVR